MNIVLVVNDNPRNLILATTQVLMLNYQVVTATIQQDAVEIANLLHPRLILADLVLENGDGLEIIKYIRQHADIGQVPIIAISAANEETHRRPVLDAGADHFVAKPYDANDLRDLIRQYMRSI
jgi:two-component system chemotaxis sensor kinase CheA